MIDPITKVLAEQTHPGFANPVEVRKSALAEANDRLSLICNKLDHIDLMFDAFFARFYGPRGNASSAEVKSSLDSAGAGELSKLTFMLNYIDNHIAKLQAVADELPSIA